MGRRLARAALAGVLLLAASSSKAQSPVRQVLLRQSVDRGNLTLDQFTGDFRVEVDQRAEKPVNVVQVGIRPMNMLNRPPVVAVVEDDAALRKAPGRLLQAGGFEPALFESAEACIDASPAALCLVVDVRLPGMSGIELQQRLRATGTPPPIIVTTASREAAVRERAEQNGCVEFFCKPVDGKALIATIASLANPSLKTHKEIAS